MAKLLHPGLLCAQLVLAASLLAPAAQADWIEDHYKVFENELQSVASALEAKDSANAAAASVRARAAYDAFLADTGKQQNLDREQFLKARQAMQVDLLRLYSALAGAYYNAKDLKQALETYHRALDVEPELALLHFQIGFLHHQLKNKQLAAAHLYEAKRMNGLPVLRSLSNPFDESFSIGAEAQELESHANELLRQLGKSTDYPITLDPDTGKERQGVIVPGVGANLKNAKGQYFNLYLNSSENQLISHLGQGKAVTQSNQPEMPVNFTQYHDGLLTVGVDKKNKTVNTIQVDETGYCTRLYQQYLCVGEPASKITALLKQGYGYQRQDFKGGVISHALNYPSLGLMFGVSPEDKILLMSIVYQP